MPGLALARCVTEIKSNLTIKAFNGFVVHPQATQKLQNFCTFQGVLIVIFGICFMKRKQLSHSGRLFMRDSMQGFVVLSLYRSVARRASKTTAPAPVLSRCVTEFEKLSAVVTRHGVVT